MNNKRWGNALGRKRVHFMRWDGIEYRIVEWVTGGISVQMAMTSVRTGHKNWNTAWRMKPGASMDDAVRSVKGTEESR